jgi:hypothetical protein
MSHRSIGVSYSRLSKSLSVLVRTSTATVSTKYVVLSMLLISVPKISIAENSKIQIRVNNMVRENESIESMIRHST